MDQFFTHYEQATSAQPQKRDMEAMYWPALRKGDRKALAALYDAYAERMLGYGLTIFKDRDLVKDGIQDVFVDLWKYRRNLGDTNNIKLYLFKALRTKIYKSQKSVAQSHHFSPVPPFVEPEWTESQESILIKMEISEKRQKRLHRAMEQLPARQREVLRNIFYEKLSYEETSFLMSMNIQSVYNLVWKAVSNLKKHVTSLLVFLFW